MKEIASVLNPPAPNMVGDGFRVHNFFPNGNRIKMSPFFLLDYNAKIEFSARTEPRGVGVHPHRGFETVTIAYHGAIAHHDSAGNSGTIYPGDVQWMTAASGILHKEYHEQNYSQTGGPFQMVQLWVNLPAAHKMSKPKYQGIKHADIPKVDLDDNGGTVEVIAGNYRNTPGAASTFSPIEVYNVRLHPGGKASFDLPESYNAGIMVIEGEVRVNGDCLVQGDKFVYFKHEGTSIELESTKESIVLLLGGEPINEPIAQYGPFLMNRPEEIKQAISDYNEGKFGYLEE